jgi:hypothetical protein
MQPWHRWREPLAVVLLIALALMLVLRAVSFLLALAAGATGGLFGSLPGGDDLLLLAAAGAVLWCATPVRLAGPADDPETDDDPRTDDRSATSPHAWAIAIAGVMIVGLTVLGWLLLSGSNVVALIVWPTPDVGFVLLALEGLLRLVVPVAALVAVVAALRRAAAARRPAVAPRPAVSAADDVPAVTPAPARLPAAWQADEATGAVWLTADDAAQGRPGLSWSDPAGTSGAVTSGPWAPAPPDAEESVAPPPAPATAPAPAPAPAPGDDDDLR